MKKFITSDLHFFHKNVITYCNRPWNTVEEMNEGMIENWNKVVTNDDIVYILGDFSLSPKAVELILPRLNGKEKILILGNHDAPFPHKLGTKSEKTAKMRERYLKAGFKGLNLTEWITLERPRTGLLGFFGLKKKYKVQLCHFPFAPVGDGKNTDPRYLNYRPKDIGQILLAGHSHCAYLKNGRMIDVGFDHKFEPWSEEELVDLIEDKRDYIPSRITEYYAARKDELVNKDEY
jgi:calcineurin-like phosphoesterase family protein